MTVLRERAAFMDSAQPASAWNSWRTARSGHKHRLQPTLQLGKKGLEPFYKSPETEVKMKKWKL